MPMIGIVTDNKIHKWVMPASTYELSSSPSTRRKSEKVSLRPEFFYFLVLGRAYPIFLKIQIKIKVPLQNFIFIFPSDCIILSKIK